MNSKTVDITVHQKMDCRILPEKRILKKLKQYPINNVI